MMHVAIPSKGRATKAKSHKVIPSATVYVPEVDYPSYQQMKYPNLVAVPMDVRGITKTRNWILDNTDDPYVVFIDDDVKRAGYIQLHSHNTTQVQMNEAQFLPEWLKLFHLMEDIGYRIWGISTDGAPCSVYPWRPFIFHTYVTASCMGILNDGRTRFDETFPVKEDYELCLRCIKEDGGILGARYFYWHNEHWETEGGCRDYRTQEMEKDAIRKLMRMYPGLIRKVTKGGSEYSIQLCF